jgi:hypothetical protein
MTSDDGCESLLGSGGSALSRKERFVLRLRLPFDERVVLEVDDSECDVDGEPMST